MSKSAAMTRWMPACWTLTTTSVPSASVARCAWATEAEASGARPNVANAASGGRPRSSSTTARICSGGSAGTFAWSSRSSAATSGPTRSIRVDRTWPSLMKVGPSSVSASRSRWPSVSAPPRARSLDGMKSPRRVRTETANICATPWWVRTRRISSTRARCSRSVRVAGCGLGTRATLPGRARADPRIRQRGERPLELLAERLEARRQREPLAEVGRVLVGVEARPHRGQLEQHAARLAEVDRAEVEAVDHLGRAGAGARDALAPALLLVEPRGEGDVVDAAGALARRRLGRRVVDVGAAALAAADLPGPVLAAGEAERVAQQRSATLRVVRVRAHAREALQRVHARDIGRVGDQRGVRDVLDHQLVVQALGVGEEQAGAGAHGLDPAAGQPLLPEVERGRRADAPDDPVDHARAGAGMVHRI